MVLIWSHITGKRQLYMDGREFHMSKAARGNTRFEHSWNITGNHVLKIIANGTPPLGEAARAMHRQFDLELDGMSYFSFCKIYELGTATGAATSGAALNKRETNDRCVYRSTRTTELAALPALTYSYRGAAYEARDDNDYEEDDVQQPPMPEVTVPPVVVDLFDSQTFTSFPVSSNLPLLTSSSTSSSSYDEFAPSTSAYQKPFDSISNDILSAYNYNRGSTMNAAPQPTVFTENTPATSCRALVPLNEEAIDPVSKSFMNLVNLDDITAAPQGQTLAPISSATYHMKQASQINNCGFVGRAPTLSELRGSTQSPTIPVQREVMKVNHQYPPATHQGYCQAQQQTQDFVSTPSYQGAVAVPSYGYQAPPPNTNMFYGASSVSYAPAY